MDYGAVRRAGCVQALRAFVRRWGVYLLIAAALFGAGAGSPVAAVSALAAWTVVPLAHAAAGGGAMLLLGLLAQAALGAALLWGARPLLWTPQWREIEHALPLSAPERRRADAWVVAFALVPWWALQAAGAAALASARPAWLMPVAGRALAALLTAQVLTAVVGVWGLERWRRGAGGGDLAAPASSAIGGSAAPRVAPWRALLWWPLWRGPARRSGVLWAVSVGTLLLPALALHAWPQAIGWWLAAASALALVSVSMLAARLRAELAPLLVAALPLPLAPTQLRRGRLVLALMPLLPGAVALALALAGSRVAVRPMVLAAWGLVAVGACVWEAAATPSSATEADRSARWLFTLVLGLALASESGA